MEKKQFRLYCTPKCSIMCVETSFLMDTSLPGQHNPATHGNGPADPDEGTPNPSLTGKNIFHKFSGCFM